MKRRTTFVLVKGKEVPTDKVKFIDICEDFQGRDQMTFEYDGEVYTSLVYAD